MAAVRWTDMAPMNPSGILNSMNQSAKQIGEAGTGIENAISGYVDDRQTSETNAFVTDLMNAGSQEERDAMIGAANTSFLNLDQINKTNYELGAPDRERKVFEEQLAAEQISAFDRLEKENTLKKEYWDHQVLNPKPTATSKNNSSKNTKSSNFQDPSSNDPTDSDGYFNRYLGGENTLGFGQGFGDNNRAEYAEYTNDFLSYKNKNGNSYFDTTDNADGSSTPDITAWHINELINNRDMVFEDRSLFEGAGPGGVKPGDNFVFNYNDKKYYFSDVKKNRDGAGDALTELIYERVIGTPSPSKKIKVAYQQEFLKNNPTLDSREGFTIFEDIYNDIENKRDQSKNSLFGKISAEEATSILNQTKEYEAAYPGASERVASMDFRFMTYNKNQLEAKVKNKVELTPIEQATLDAINARLNEIQK